MFGFGSKKAVIDFYSQRAMIYSLEQKRRQPAPGPRFSYKMLRARGKLSSVSPQLLILLRYTASGWAPLRSSSLLFTPAPF